MKWPRIQQEKEAAPAPKVAVVVADDSKEEEQEIGVEVTKRPKSKGESSSPAKEPALGKKFCQFCTLEIPMKAIRCYHCHADQVLKSVMVDEDDEAYRVVKFNGFKIHKVDILDEDDVDAGPVFTDSEFKISDKYLQMAISRLGIQMVHRGFTEKEQKPGYIKGEKLVLQLPRLKASWAMEKSGMVKSLLAQIEATQATMRTQINKLLEKKKIVFPGLWFIFEQGAQIFSWKAGAKLGATIVRSDYQYNFNVTGEMIKTDGQQFFFCEESFTIDKFNGVKKLEDLEIQIMDPETMDELIQRGQLFNKLGINHHFRQYSGFMMRSFSKFFTTKIPADGRVMIDVGTYNRMNPNDVSFRFSGVSSRQNQYNQQQHMYDSWGNVINPVQVNPNQFATVAPENLFMCWPTLMGFSFKKKQWGEFLVSLCEEIVFDDKAFDQLVLEKEKKSLIKSLVECQENAEVINKGFNDIISGKGGGCIFLLHGPPGTGKTLTAEAVSEHLHTPLYSVSVGELGTTPESLETNLQKILEVAGIWKASILMDEADIFLERRTKSNIIRNAMVGIFLRLLEYHNGVLFLTTNRIKAIDEAFNSRISIALHYDDLDHISRGQVWMNFFNHIRSSEGNGAVADDIDLHELVRFNLNGRQIRSTVKLSQALAVYEKSPLSMHHLRSTIAVALSFEEKFEEQVKSKRREKHLYKNRLDKKGKGKKKTVTVEVD